MTKKRHSELSDIETRLARASGLLAAELRWRGIASRRRSGSTHQPRLTGVLFAAELANADRQLAARAVLRGLLSRDELKALGLLLKFQPRSDKLDELIRAVERKQEGGADGNRG